MRHISQLRQGAKDLTEIIKHHFTSSCLASQQVNQKFKICFLSSFVVGQERTSQPVRERLQMGTRMCGNVGAVDKEKTSLHVLNIQQIVFPICITRTKFPGADHFYQKNGSCGTIFLLKISVWGTKIFTTKIPVTGQLVTRSTPMKSIYHRSTLHLKCCPISPTFCPIRERSISVTIRL